MGYDSYCRGGGNNPVKEHYNICMTCMDEITQEEQIASHIGTDIVVIVLCAARLIASFSERLCVNLAQIKQ